MTRLHLALGVLSILGGGSLAACSKTAPEPDRSSSDTVVRSGSSAPSSGGAAVAPSAASASPAQAPSPTTTDEVAWTAPASWTNAPNANPMRKATYKIGEDAELTV